MNDDTPGMDFVTFCRACKRPARYRVSEPPSTAADLEALRRRVAEACPDHGTITMEEASLATRAGDFPIAPPVIDELGRLAELGGGRAS